MEPHLGHGGLAYEYGCGVGHGALFLASRGYRVIAIDSDPQAVSITRSRIPSGAPIQVMRAELANLLPERCDVVCAVFALFFLERAGLARLWNRTVQALAPGGLFLGQFLGPNDDWVSRGYTTHSENQVRSMLQTLEILHLDEVERDGETALGDPKHWHVFHVLARKS